MLGGDDERRRQIDEAVGEQRRCARVEAMLR
jgi:hypothetical protein